MQAPSDLITTIKLTAAEYLRWQEVAVERFRDVPGLSAVLLEMQQNENLYNFVAQKGIYQYRTKLDPDVWQEIVRRYTAAREQLAPYTTSENLPEPRRQEFAHVFSRMEAQHAALTEAVDDWFYQQSARTERKAQKGCLGLGVALLAIGVSPAALLWWWLA